MQETTEDIHHTTLQIPSRQHGSLSFAIKNSTILCYVQAKNLCSGARTKHYFSTRQGVDKCTPGNPTPLLRLFKLTVILADQESNDSFHYRDRIEPSGTVSSLSDLRYTQNYKRRLTYHTCLPVPHNCQSEASVKVDGLPELGTSKIGEVYLSSNSGLM